MQTVLESKSLENLFPQIAPRDHRLVWIDGVFSDSLSRVGELPPGVSISVLEQGRTICLEASDKAAVDETFWFLYGVTEHATSVNEESYRAFLRVVAGMSTRLNVVTGYLSEPRSRCRLYLEADFRLAENACVDHYQFERMGEEARFECQNRYWLKKHSSVDGVVFTEGAKDSHYTSSVHFSEAHAFASLKGLSLLGGRAQTTHTIRVAHEAPHCISRQYYKSILAGSARSDFSSRVEIGEGAAKSDSEQLNRNLLLSGEATAISKPELKIDHDDVTARHGSATGELQESEVFYLQSRGLSRAAARTLLVRGFADEILGAVQEKSLKAYLEGIVQHDLPAVTGEWV